MMRTKSVSLRPAAKLLARPGRSAGGQSFAPCLRAVAWLLVACVGWTYGASPCIAAAESMQGQPPALKTRVPRRLPAVLPSFPYRQAAAATFRTAAHGLPEGAGGATAPPAALTLLDSVGILNRTVTPEEASGWKTRLGSPALPAAEAAQLHLWIGEWTLAQQQPVQARHQFDQAGRLTAAADPLHGIAAYDTAVSLFREGAYQSAAEAFRALLGPQRSPGYDMREASLWLRHARACAGYHDDHARLGIPEPPVLDPLCGAASLAACLRALHRAYDKQTVLKSCRVTGEGSTLGDLLVAGRKVHVDVQAITADEAGLQALPKPAVAYVEQDHFVAVVRADRRGVSYLCSDCGLWPGGRVDLTWEQWRALDPGVYLTVSSPGTPQGKQISQALETPSAAIGRTVPSRPMSVLSAPVRVSMTGSLSQLHLKVHTASLPGLSGHIARYVAPAGAVTCGTKPSALHCPKVIKCPMDHGNPCADPVNLATGEEEYQPSPDLTVYNPQGPSVVWARTYNSLRAPGAGYNPGDATYECSDYGVGWTQSYNVGVYDPSGGTGSGNSSPKYVYFPNGSRMPFWAPAVPNSTVTKTGPTMTASTRVACTVAPGSPFLVEWDYGGLSGTYFVITFMDHSQWTTYGINSKKDSVSGQPINCYELAGIMDRNGNSISFNYTSQPNGWDLLSNIRSNASGAPILLTINRAGDGTGNITSVTDLYGRTVYYNVAAVKTYDPYNTLNPSFQELEHVSQIVATGAASTPDRYAYAYTNIANGDGGTGASSEGMPFLTGISEPSPTGNGLSTATINYAPVTGYVTSLVDANQNTRSYSSTDAADTKVTIADKNGNVAYSFTDTFNPAMSWVRRTRSDGTRIFTADYPSGAPNPNSPYSVSDGNKNTWYYVWDSYGLLHRSVTPRGVVTDLTWSFPAAFDPGTINCVHSPAGTGFPLGELMQVQESSSTAKVQKSPTLFTYYDQAGQSGLIQSVSAPPVDTNAGTGGSVQAATFFYDGYGNVTSINSPLGNGNASSFTTTFNYASDPGDSAHGVPAASQNVALGQPLTVTDNLGHVTHLRYDLRGNVVTSYDALGNRSDASYNLADQVTQTKMPATGQTGTGRAYGQTTYLYTGGPPTSMAAYDESANLVRSANYTYGLIGEATGASGDADTFGVTYDALYRPLTISDGNNNPTTYTYDPVYGNLASVRYPRANTSTGYDTISYSGHDGDGQTTQVTDGRGVTSTFSYNDPESALTSVASPAVGSIPTQSASVSYDPFGRVSSTVRNVGDTSVGSFSTQHVYTYDDLDEIVQAQTISNGTAGSQPAVAISGAASGAQFGSSNVTLTYAHNPDGSVKTMGVPAGNGSFVYSYDGGGRLQAVKNPSSEVTSWMYQDNDWLSSQQLNSGATTYYTYNAAGQMTDLKTYGGGTSGPLLSEFGSLSYDGVGNLSSVTASGVAPGLTTYTYDGQDQLKSETSSRGASLGTISYDGAGNSSLGGGGNTDNQAPYTTYDGNGNPASTQGGASLAFDASNKATLIGGNQVLSSYGPDGLRSEKTGAGGARFFAYDGSDPVVETTSNSNLVAVNTFGPAGLVSRYNPTSGVSTFYTPDERGNVAQRLTSAGTVASSDLYNAFGKKLAGGGASGDPYGFGGMAGYYTDTETGLSLLGERYYDPNVGRFLTRDPIGYAGGMNLYRYAGNNPVNFMDPLGLDPGYWDGFGRDYWGHFGNFGKGIGRGFGNFGATTATGMLAMSVPGGALPSSVENWQPFGAACNEDEADGQQFGYDLAFVGSFFTGEGEAAEAGQGAKFLQRAERGCFGECFVAGTLVQMTDGSTKPIQQVQVGDQVLSRDPATGKEEAKTVTATIERHAPSVVDVELHDAKTGASETLTCTPEHPLYVQGQGWVEAGSLGIGTSIVSRAGPALEVTDLTWEKNKAQELAAGTGSSFGGYTVYNLTVDGDHTFFVGTSGGGTWVHNGFYQCNLIPGKGGSLTKGPRVSYQKALDMVKQGIDLVADSGREARSIAKSASPTNSARGEIHGSPADGFYPHFHTLPRFPGDGHIFY